MRTNPFNDAYEFLIGTSSFHQSAGVQGQIMIPLFWFLLIASIAIASINWRQDPNQRTTEHLVTWFFRVVIGVMWFEGSIWKLPLPVSGGFGYWLDEVGRNAAFEFHREIANSVFKPLLVIVNPAVFLTELAMATSFMLGFAVRFFGVIGMLFALHLYFGLYRHGAEWPWLFIFLIFVQGFFVLHAAGRSLGLDALFRRAAAKPDTKRKGIGALYRKVS